MINPLPFFQEKVVFLGKKLPKNHEFSFQETFKEHWIETPDKGEINAVHFTVENPKGLIFYLHGNSSNIEKWGKKAKQFTQFHYDFFVMDYRGFGKSTGFRNEKIMHQDVQSIYDFLKKIYKQENIIVYGRSLGGAFAVKLASENTPKKVILDATFYNLQTLVSRWIPKFVTQIVSPFMPYHFNSYEYIKKITSPLFHFHGDKDPTVPIKFGKKLFKEFEISQPQIEKKFIEIKGGNHKNLAKFEKYESELKSILLEH